MGIIHYALITAATSIVLFLTCSNPASTTSEYGCTPPAKPSCSSSGTVIFHGEVYTIGDELVAIINNISRNLHEISSPMHFIWNGTGCNGQKLPTGTYILKTVMCMNGRLTTTTTTRILDYETEPPDTPENLHVKVIGDRKVSLSWDRTERTVAYLIQFDDIHAPDTVPYTTTGTYLTSDTIHYLYNNHTYSFSVAAANNAGPSAFSVPETLYLPQVTPATPTKLSATIDDQRAYIKCENVPGALFYVVYYDSDSTAVKKGKAAGSVRRKVSNDYAYTFSPAFLIDSIHNDSLYYYALVAGNDAGVSPLSTLDTFRPMYETPYITGYELGRKTVTLWWFSVPRAEEYHVHIDTFSTTTSTWKSFADTIVTNDTVTIGPMQERFYQATIRAFDGITWSEQSMINEIEYRDPPPPMTPTAGNDTVFLDLKGNMHNRLVVVSQDSVFDSSDTWYEVRKSTGKLTVPGLTNGTLYYFASQWDIYDISSRTQLTALSDPVTCIPRPPGPSNLFAQHGDAVLFLGWDSVPGASEYRLYFETGDSVDANSTMRVCHGNGDTISGLSNKLSYSALVSAMLDGLETQFSEKLLTGPNPPVCNNLQTFSQNEAIIVTWDSPDTGYTFNIMISKGNNDMSLIAQRVTSPYKIEGLTNGTTYTVYVETNSKFDDATSGTPVSSNTPQPLSFIAASLQSFDQSLWVRWHAPDTSLYYTVRYEMGNTVTEAATVVNKIRPPYTIENLENNRQYAVVVSVYDSVMSNILLASPSAPCADCGMKSIDGGTYVMGDSLLYKDMREHKDFVAKEVKVTSFLIDSTEVTYQDFYILMGKPGMLADSATYPIRNINWFQAVLYCNKRSIRDGFDTVYSYDSLSFGKITFVHDLDMNFAKSGYRLPTEVEWEYACRAGTTSDYYWGNTLNAAFAWTDALIHPVALLEPNGFGLYDMSGNVAEWCTTLPPYLSTPNVDPKGFDVFLSTKVARGISFDYRSAGRQLLFVSNLYPMVGFRTVRHVIDR